MKALAFALLAALAGGCAFSGGSADPQRYRLAHSGSHWDVSGDDRVFADLEPRYSEFFEAILDPDSSDVPNLLQLRGDLERAPVDRRNYDALNAVAIAYFETNYQAETRRGEDMGYITLSQRSLKLLAVPWRAYGEIDEGALRDAILDFFQDVGTGEKLSSAATAGRLVDIVASLERKEDDPARAARIRAIRAGLIERWRPDMQ